MISLKSIMNPPNLILKNSEGIPIYIGVQMNSVEVPARGILSFSSIIKVDENNMVSFDDLVPSFDDSKASLEGKAASFDGKITSLDGKIQSFGDKSQSFDDKFQSFADKMQSFADKKSFAVGIKSWNALLFSAIEKNVALN